MSDYQSFARNIERKAKRAEMLKQAIAWMVRGDNRETILSSPEVQFSHFNASATNGYAEFKAMMTDELTAQAEQVAQNMLVKAKAELADLEAFFEAIMSPEQTL